MENMRIMVRPEIEEMMDIAFIEDAEPDNKDADHLIVGVGFAHPVQLGWPTEQCLVKQGISGGWFLSPLCRLQAHPQPVQPTPPG
jgi:hypothetical protein